MDDRTVQLDKKKHDSGMVMLLIGLERSGNCGKSGNRETQVRKSI